MDSHGSYRQFCPVALASEVVCARWTTLILRDLFAGSSRFNELQRGVPRMSPALLSKRLRDMEAAGVIERMAHQGAIEYRLTEAGRDLAPVVEALGRWGLRWVDPDVALQKLDAPLLMWTVRLHLDPVPPPPRRCTIEFTYPELPARRRRFWLIVDGEEVDLCATDPGFEVDLYVTADLRAMTAIWLGLTTPRREIEAGTVEINGPPELVGLLLRWLGQCPASQAREQFKAAS